MKGNYHQVGEGKNYVLLTCTLCLLLYEHRFTYIRVMVARAAGGTPLRRPGAKRTARGPQSKPQVNIHNIQNEAAEAVTYIQGRCTGAQRHPGRDQDSFIRYYYPQAATAACCL